MAQPNVAAPPAGKPPVIRGLSSRAGLAASGMVVLMSWVVSVVTHGLIIGFAILVAFLITGADNSVQAGTNVAETNVDDAPDNHDLTNPDIGLNPEVPLNYNV